jgi:hypothetical protein
MENWKQELAFQAKDIPRVYSDNTRFMHKGDLTAKQIKEYETFAISFFPGEENMSLYHPVCVNTWKRLMKKKKKEAKTT